MIGILDYGIGNISAFLNVYKELGISCFLVKTKEDLHKATKIILPGVGHFDFAMSKLSDSGMIEDLNVLVLEKKIPILGVCVGMQMMTNQSEEGCLDGLGWIPATVKKLDTTHVLQQTTLPHMGWNTIEMKNYSKLLDGFESQEDFYFLHSYFVECNDSTNILATTTYGQEFTSIFHNENIYGIQCHPEKSHKNGVKFLKNFAEL